MTLLRVGIAAALLAAPSACGGRWPQPGDPATAPPPAAAPVVQLEARVLADSSAIAFLVREGTQRSHVEQDFRHLTEAIGPRLTGSPAMRRANDWTAAKLREYGADSVALEPWPFGFSWHRGPTTMHMIRPHYRRIDAASWAWAPSTGGPVAGDVVFVDAATRADFDLRFAGKLKGAWVMLERPYPRVNPWGASARDSARVDSLRRLRFRQRTAEE